MEKSGLGCHLLPISVFPAPNLLLITSIDAYSWSLCRYLMILILINPKPPSNEDLISPEFGEIAGFGLPALCRFWVLGVWEVSRPRTIPILGLEHISLAEQLCPTVIDMVISCTLMYIFVHWKGWLGWSISAIMSLDIGLMWRDGDERRKNRQLAAVYIMYARVYLYIGEILPPVIDYV